ncbi:MAG: hypothetical protein LBD12_04400 [Clostridiales Family XIII bacterium]|jgi:hypothetical protein|nr:hypothetical protein [Clostridiales Family XIII bacterium]
MRTNSMNRAHTPIPATLCLFLMLALLPVLASLAACDRNAEDEPPQTGGGQTDPGDDVTSGALQEGTPPLELGWVIKGDWKQPENDSGIVHNYELYELVPYDEDDVRHTMATLKITRDEGSRNAEQAA